MTETAGEAQGKGLFVLEDAGDSQAGDPQAWVCWMDKEEGCSRLRSSLGKGPSTRKSLVCSGYREKLCAGSMWTGGWRGRWDRLRGTLGADSWKPA